MPDRGNILLVANWESNVGYAWWLMEDFWLEISRYFEKEDKRCLLIYPKITRVPDSISSSNIEVAECNFRDRSFTNLNKLHKILKSNKIRFIYLSDSPAYCIFYILLRLWGVKNIVVHDHTPGDRTIPRSWTKLVKTLVQRIPFYTADHFIAVTEYIYNRFIKVYRIPASKCSIAQNGIQPVDLNNIDTKYTYKTFDIPENRLIVVTTGRATFYKGIDFFIECANELVNNQGIAQLHFLYCGDGPDINHFESLVTQLNIQGYFTFAGKRNDIRKILPSCHIGFHAARGEVGYSLSILEYMSSGIATIVPDTASTSGATTENVTGLLYQPGNIKSACNTIMRCMDTTLRETLAANAIKEVIEHYNICQTRHELITILKKPFS